MKWLLFLLLPVVKCVIILRENQGILPKPKETKRGKPARATVEIYSLPLYKTHFVSLYVSFGTRFLSLNESQSGSRIKVRGPFAKFVLCIPPLHSGQQMPA